MIKMKLKKTIFFIISGPSGAGEDSVIEGLKDKIKYERVITTVTRGKRIGEREGFPYYFVSRKKFESMIKKDAFIEWADVYGDYRGATKKEIERLNKKNALALWKVDFQGVETIKKKIPGVLSVLILPPSLKVLEERLIKRKTDTPETIKKRLPFTKKWLKQRKSYDYTVINEENKLEETIDRVLRILLENLQKC
ncbi:guanylate kinase [Candidatus Falkowbacteria bacterium RIFOXYB2_FULL_38_15]|uniref:Guanylate kinase n=1 Tax=Candidatus Falkowbacteria bacterium RIFOXYA2_FULL_38_12 TaxID=1797993 RepID=A0A1F5S4L9_9BACT|nr:MAG: guanylate kinase [Candidatus Falkowbacteria bacterium RIFOXYA2_FULL_38_12]OGF32788.1 MAG: guanylate kinase [Candidatus Falkowbacteria bacterium RIFOXYB2_FULL_38_15]OGF42176.1 MAG: guanylate kinase [Candidatus Falkowbacteria bacterium RIFOXYD2_FULL_39_16]